LLHLPTLKAGALLFFILNKVSLIDHNMKLLSVELTTEQARFCSKLWSWVIVAAFSVEKTNLFFFFKKKKKINCNHHMHCTGYHMRSIVFLPRLNMRTTHHISCILVQSFHLLEHTLLISPHIYLRQKFSLSPHFAHMHA
jgi:hypothetical protein